MRCHLCTERITRDQERCPAGHPTKPEPSQILLHLQQLVVVWSKEKKSIHFNVLPPIPYLNNLLLRSSWGGVSNAFSKSNMNVSTCPLLSKILAQSFITVVNWVSQLCPFLNARCLSDRSLLAARADGETEQMPSLIRVFTRVIRPTQNRYVPNIVDTCTSTLERSILLFVTPCSIWTLLIV